MHQCVCVLKCPKVPWCSFSPHCRRFTLEIQVNVLRIYWDPIEGMRWGVLLKLHQCMTSHVQQHPEWLGLRTATFELSMSRRDTHSDPECQYRGWCPKASSGVSSSTAQSLSLRISKAVKPKTLPHQLSLPDFLPTACLKLLICVFLTRKSGLQSPPAP